MHLSDPPTTRAPFYGVRAQAPLAGPGPPQQRRCIHQPLRERYTQILALHRDVAAAATDRVASRLLYDPFRVDHIAIQVEGDAADDLRVNLYTDNQETGAGTTGDRGRSGLWQAQNEGLQANELLPWVGQSTLAAGQIVRSVPTRVILVAINGEAAALGVSALVTVTFLFPVVDPVAHGLDF